MTVGELKQAIGTFPDDASLIDISIDQITAQNGRVTYVLQLSESTPKPPRKRRSEAGKAKVQP